MSQAHRLLKSLSTAPQFGERHRPSGLDPAFHRGTDSLDAYVAAGRHHVEAGRTDLEDPQQRDWIIDGNSPFLLQPAVPDARRRAILMVHGLSDAPFLVRDIAGFFQAQGFCVLGMLLPGHGTRPGDLLHCRWQDWVDAHDHLLGLLRARYDELHLLGFSAGATLNLYQALRHPGIRALYLFSPAVRVGSLAALAGPLAWCGRWSRRMAWFDVQPDSDSFKYESLTQRAIHEVVLLTRAYRRLNRIQPLSTPVFAAASADDVTIDSRAGLSWFAGLGGAPRRMLWYSDREPDLPAGVRRVSAADPQRRIQSYAHTALLSAPSNPHYGEQGSQRSCTHYYRLAPDKYRRCKAGEEDCLGEMFGESADCQVLRRLTYNPRYEDMLGEIRDFHAALDGAPAAPAGV